MSQPLVSAIICTHNRARFLDQALAGLAVQTLKPESYEILVVDNASNDNTAQIAELWGNKLENCHYIYEANLGLSYARNRGLKEAHAPIVAYLDDDAIPEPQWLSALLKAYSDISPTPVAVGGKILLKWLGAQPSWLNHIGLLQMLGYTDQGGKIIPVRHISGGNMSFQKDILSKYSGFDPRLGRRGNLQLTAEESELELRMRNDGYILYYQPDAVVWHQIDESKLKPAYLIQRYYAHGQSDALRYVLNKWPGRFEIMKLIIRQLYRNSNILFQFHKASWLGYYPSSVEGYWIRCKSSEFIGFQLQMIKLLLFGRAIL